MKRQFLALALLIAVPAFAEEGSGINSAADTVPVPQESFSEFFKKAQRSKALQRQRMQPDFAVTEVFLRDEQEPFVRRLACSPFQLEKAGWVLLPGAKELQEAQVEYHIHRTSPSRAEVLLGPANSEADALYIFVRENGLWRWQELRLYDTLPPEGIPAPSPCLR